MVNNYTIYFDNRKILLISNLCDYFKEGVGLLVEHKEFDDLTKVLDFFQSSSISPLYIYSKDIDSLFQTITNHFQLIEAAGGLVRNQQGQILIIKRNGLWDLPKGKVDEGEQIDRAAIREVTEECNISPLELHDILTVTYHTYLLDGKKILKRSTWYNMSYNGNQTPSPQVNENITEAKWIDTNQIAECMQNTYPAIKDVFRAVNLY
jgi:ADP-ribose pyrophosphatase YjhB (NUDIX family)